jgi:transcriptional regulator with XRE-family HTH domain
MAASHASSDLAATVGSRIRAARKSALMTQHQLAVALGAGDAMKISRWERGEHLPSGESLAALAVVLGRTPSWFYESESVAA